MSLTIHFYSARNHLIAVTFYNQGAIHYCIVVWLNIFIIAVPMHVIINPKIFLKVAHIIAFSTYANASAYENRNLINYITETCTYDKDIVGGGSHEIKFKKYYEKDENGNTWSTSDILVKNGYGDISQWCDIFLNTTIMNNLLKPPKQPDMTVSSDLIKDRCYLAFVYMTGLIPIAVSFSKNKKLTFEDLEDGYNGYKAYNNEKNFNICSNRIENCWSETGRYNEVKRINNYDIVDVKKDILELINGNEIEIILTNYGRISKKNQKIMNI
ncbi:hypothetical protein H8356DRAFT_1346270 [Neocallimastix lanati (nom. inval.)]|nr:hypothetical protein H8356DRAFT_1346270 [Neocallimastix sp. JGI-2020a]